MLEAAQTTRQTANTAATAFIVLLIIFNQKRGNTNVFSLLFALSPMVPGSYFKKLFLVNNFSL